MYVCWPHTWWNIEAPMKWSLSPSLSVDLKQHGATLTQLDKSPIHTTTKVWSIFTQFNQDLQMCCIIGAKHKRSLACTTGEVKRQYIACRKTPNTKAQTDKIKANQSLALAYASLLRSSQKYQNNSELSSIKYVFLLAACTTYSIAALSSPPPTWLTVGCPGNRTHPACQIASPASWPSTLSDIF